MSRPAFASSVPSAVMNRTSLPTTLVVDGKILRPVISRDGDLPTP